MHSEDAEAQVAKVGFERRNLRYPGVVGFANAAKQHIPTKSVFYGIVLVLHRWVAGIWHETDPITWT